MGEKGKLLRAPDAYMEKIAVGPRARGAIDLRRSPTENLRRIADALGKYVEDLTVVILDRPRHEKLIREVREAGARIKLIADGDLAGAINTCFPETGVDVLMGIGGAPEGVICGDRAALHGRRHAGAAACRETTPSGSACPGMGIADVDRRPARRGPGRAATSCSPRPA